MDIQIQVEYIGDEIPTAINKVVVKKITSDYLYGKGDSANLFLEIINKDSIWEKDIQKSFYRN